MSENSFQHNNIQSAALNKNNNRILSIDCLRGFDILFLIAIQPILWKLLRLFDNPFSHFCQNQLTHKSWDGFSTWDLVMPLFMFISGISIPFALQKHCNEGYSHFKLWIRMIRRVLILWVLGMIVQGQLLRFDIHSIYLYSNTLQSIAVGCLIAFAAVLYLKKTRSLVILTAGLLLTYWGVMEWISVDSFGGGNYSPTHNLAEWIDQAVLGRFRDGAHLGNNGQVIFNAHYHYTWILSSLNFGAITLFGAIAGRVLKTENILPITRFYRLCIIGTALLILGWGWHFLLPVIKPIFSSSMVCVAAGYSFLILASFYFFIDILKIRKGTTFLTIIGSNAIVAYVLHERFGFTFHPFIKEIFGGSSRFLGEFYPVAIQSGEFLLIFLFLFLLFKLKIFIKA